MSTSTESKPRVNFVPGWYPPMNVPVAVGIPVPFSPLRAEVVTSLVEAFHAAGQYAMAAEIASRGGEDYVAPELTTDEDEGDGKDPWLDQINRDAERVCAECWMVLPLTGICEEVH